MYAVGTHAQDPFAMSNGFASNPAMSYYATTPQQFAPQPIGQPGLQQVHYTPAPAARTRTASAPRQQTVYRSAEPQIVSRTVDTKPERSKTKTVLVIGGSAASGAGLGGLLGGKKGALVGAALGGGAASIYEATRR
jgi:hypothetical protein